MEFVMDVVGADDEKTRSLLLCDGMIAGADVYHHTVVAGREQTFAARGDCFHILLLFEGNAVFETGGKAYAFDERTSFVPALDQALTVKADTLVQMLEIRWTVAPGDAEEMAQYETVFPLIQKYADAKQYKDRNKSDKSISRVVIEQRNIPRFCMGSVESYGHDYVKPHAHPMLDQFFFSFPENDMEVIIDGERVPMGGNVLLYIPLGSDHGVEVFEDRHMHYMWIDFMVDDTAMARLDTSHIATGTMRSLDRERSAN